MLTGNNPHESSTGSSCGRLRTPRCVTRGTPLQPRTAANDLAPFGAARCGIRLGQFWDLPRRVGENPFRTPNDLVTYGGAGGRSLCVEQDLAPHRPPGYGGVVGTSAGMCFAHLRGISMTMGWPLRVRYDLVTSGTPTRHTFWPLLEPTARGRAFDLGVKEFSPWDWRPRPRGPYVTTP
jgi:hypothetical protein